MFIISYPLNGRNVIQRVLGRQFTALRGLRVPFHQRRRGTKSPFRKKRTRK